MKNSTLKTLLYTTIHRNKKSVAQIADETGISTNYLYRAGLPLEESGVKFPVDYLLPLMNSTKDFSVLKHLANLSGFVLIKIPKLCRNKAEEIELVDEYQQATINAVRLLKDFLNTPNSLNYQKASDALMEVMTKSAYAKKVADKTASGQLELDLE
jgi:hypothetical protein